MKYFSFSAFFSIIQGKLTAATVICQNPHDIFRYQTPGTTAPTFFLSTKILVQLEYYQNQRLVVSFLLPVLFLLSCLSVGGNELSLICKETMHHVFINFYGAKKQYLWVYSIFTENFVPVEISFFSLMIRKLTNMALAEQNDKCIPFSLF